MNFIELLDYMQYELGQNSQAKLNDKLDDYLKAGGTIYQQNSLGRTLVTMAARLNQTHIVQELLEKGNTPEFRHFLNAYPEFLSAPLLSAIDNKNIDMARILLRYVPNAFYEGNQVGYCIKIAQEFKANEIAQLISDCSIQFLAMSHFTNQKKKSEEVKTPPKSLPVTLDALFEAIDNTSPTLFSLLDTYLKENNHFNRTHDGYTVLTKITQAALDARYSDKDHACYTVLLKTFLEKYKSIISIDREDAWGQSALMYAQTSDSKYKPEIMAMLIPTMLAPKAISQDPSRVFVTPSAPSLSSFEEIFLNLMRMNTPGVFKALDTYLKEKGNINDLNAQGYTIFTQIGDCATSNNYSNEIKKYYIKLLTDIINRYDHIDINKKDELGRSLKDYLDKIDPSLIHQQVQNIAISVIALPKSPVVIHAPRVDLKATLQDVQKAIVYESNEDVKSKLLDYLQQGLDINAKGDQGFTILTLAVDQALLVKENIVILETVLNALRGTDIEVADGQGRTALSQTENKLYNDQNRVKVKALIEFEKIKKLPYPAPLLPSKALVANKPLVTMNALIKAIEENDNNFNSLLSDYLGQKGNSINDKMESGRTLLTYLVIQGPERIKMLETFLKYATPSDVRMLDDHNHSSRQLALKAGYEEGVKLLDTKSTASESKYAY